MRRELILLALLASGCDRASKPTPTTRVLASAPYFEVGLAPLACTAAAACDAKLVITARGGFEVNEDYPYKFVPDAASASAAPGPGTFAHTAKTEGVLTVPLAAGTTRVAGTLKLSVCTDAECKIEAPAIVFDAR